MPSTHDLVTGITLNAASTVQGRDDRRHCDISLTPWRIGDGPLRTDKIDVVFSGTKREITAVARTLPGGRMVQLATTPARRRASTEEGAAAKTRQAYGWRPVRPRDAALSAVLAARRQPWTAHHPQLGTFVRRAWVRGAPRSEPG